MEENIENIETDTDIEKDFQNLLAVRGQLVTLLIATAGGTVWLSNKPFTWLNLFFILTGAFFITRLIAQMHNTNSEIRKIIKRRN